MKGTDQSTRFKARDGFALMVAICGVFVMTMGGITVRHATMAEMWDATLVIQRSRAKIAALAGLEHALAELASFVQSGKDSLELEQATSDISYMVTLTRSDTKEFDPLASQLGAGDKLVLAKIVSRSAAPLSSETKESRGDIFEEKLAVVIDPADGGEVLLWIPDYEQGEE